MSTVRIALKKDQASKYTIEVKQLDGTWKEKYRFTKERRAQDIIDRFFIDSIQEKLFKYE